MAENNKKWHEHPMIVAVIGGFIAAALAIPATIFVNNRSKQDEFSISAESCSEKGPTKAFLENIKTHYRVEMPSSEMPAIVERVISITNNGTKMIDNDRLFISFSNLENTTILSEKVFAESVLADHIADAGPKGDAFSIVLKKFNPHDRIYIVIDTTKPVGVGVDSKGAGYTLSSRFDPSCGIFGSMKFSGVEIFQHTSEDCTDDVTQMSCHRNLKFKLPEGFPPGPARVVFE